MANPLDALLGQISDPIMRAAICAGWELGKGLDPRRVAEKQIRREIEKGAEIVGRKADLDVDVIHGAALLSMALTRDTHQE